MTKRTRYLLLLTGFILFLICAPIVVLYVSGFAYDAKSNAFVKTGILAIRTEPKDVQIFVNGELTRTSAGDVKFLAPGEYEVRLEKAGYQVWSKRLRVKEGEVTWANPVPHKLYLFKEKHLPAQLQKDVADFVLTDSELIALSQAFVTIAPLGSPADVTTLAATGSPQRILLSPNQNQALLLSTTAAASILNLADKTITPLNGLFEPEAQFSFSDGGDVYALQTGTLYRVSLWPAAKTAIASHIRSFKIASGNLYYLKDNGQKNPSLELLPLSGGPQQTLVAAVPDFSSGSVLVSPQKQLLLLLDERLFRVSDKLESVSDSVRELIMPPGSSEILVHYGGELGSYNYFTQKLDFLTRTNLPIRSFSSHGSYGFLLTIRGSAAVALELGQRDRQNEYIFYEGAGLTKLLADRQFHRIFFLDSTSLYSQTIR